MSRDYAKRYRNRSALKAAKPPKAKRSGVLKDGPGFGPCGFTMLPAAPSALLSGDGVSAIAAVAAFNSITLRRQAQAREARRLAAMSGISGGHVIEKAAPAVPRSGPVVVTSGD
jgi:hypothetical protein